MIHRISDHKCFVVWRSAGKKWRNGAIIFPEVLAGKEGKDAVVAGMYEYARTVHRDGIHVKEAFDDRKVQKSQSKESKNYRCKLKGDEAEKRTPVEFSQRNCKSKTNSVCRKEHQKASRKKSRRENNGIQNNQSYQSKRVRLLAKGRQGAKQQGIVKVSLRGVCGESRRVVSAKCKGDA